jgi:hypothetical protein
MNLDILPLAIPMMAGPQLMLAIDFVTGSKPVKVSAAFIAGVAIATIVGVAIAFATVLLLGSSIRVGDSSRNATSGHVIQYVLVGLLVLNYVRRETIEPPKWLGRLLSADSKKALVTGLLVILLVPSDMIIMLTVGVNLAQGGFEWFCGLVAALPFIGATVLLAALPLLLFLLFQRRAQRLMPHVRDWMTSNSWMINIIFCGVFIALIVGR